MAGKRPWHESKDGHNPKEVHRFKDGSRHFTSPHHTSLSGPGFPSSANVDRDGTASIAVSPLVGQTPPMAVEQKLAAQHAEIQRLLNENQRLAVTHVALRQEFAAAQQEIMRLFQSRPFNDTEKEQRFAITQVALRQELADAKQEVNKLHEAMTTMQTEKDQHIRMAIERGAQMEAELKEAESFKANFEKLQYQRDELLAHVDRLTGELKKLPSKDNEIASLKSEIDELRQRHQQARMDFEQQKKINLENLEQKQVLETKIFTMSREIDRLNAELEQKLHNVYPASSGTVLTPSLHSSAITTGSFENLGQQDASKSIRPVMDHSDGKSNTESARFQPGRQDPPANVEATVEWAKQAAANGKLLYSGPAAQWNKPSSNVGADPHSSHQRQMSQAQGHQEQISGSESGIVPAQVQISPSMMQLQPTPSQQTIPSAPMHQGVNLLVLGLSEGITDRDLASLFYPYGAISYAKVMVDTKSGSSEYYGIVTMENTQAAEAAAVAVNGMFILGRHIKVELQSKEQSIPHQQTYPHQTMHQGIMQGGVGPVRWQHRAAPLTGGRWPY